MRAGNEVPTQSQKRSIGTMDMEMLLGAIVFGFSISAILLLMSFGISIGFGLMRIVNMEQMIYYTFGAYITYTSI